VLRRHALGNDTWACAFQPSNYSSPIFPFCLFFFFFFYFLPNHKKTQCPKQKNFPPPRRVSPLPPFSLFFFFFLPSPKQPHKRAERRARNIAGAEARVLHPSLVYPIARPYLATNVSFYTGACLGNTREGMSLGRARFGRGTTARQDDKFTPTKHLTSPPHHSSRPVAAHTDTETPLLHKKKGRARRRTAPTDLAHSWPTQARPSLFNY